MSSTKPKVVAASLALLCLGGCGHSTTATAPTSTPSTNPTEQAVDDAIHAYYGARKVDVEVGKNPRRTAQEYPPAVGLTQYLEGSALDDEVKAGASYLQTGFRVNYELGLSTPSVVKVDPSRRVVVLAHCASDEKTTMTRGGATVAAAPGPGQAPFPHLSTYTMTQREGQWRLSKITENASRTCHSDAG